MRELEFTPEWYRQSRRGKRIIVMEVWALVLLVGGLSAWAGVALHNIRSEQASLESLRRQLDQTHDEQRMLDEQLALRQELQARQQMIASLGFPLEVTRLLQTLDSVMPREMSLVEFNCDTDEQIRQVTNVMAARMTQDADGSRQLDRRLKVRLVGVAPSDIDLANFLAGLTNVSFFEQVAVTYARDRSEAGHVLREFEVTFSMNLNQPTMGN